MENTVMEYTPKEMHTQVQLIQQVMKEVMIEGQHFGLVPGCGPKPALLKAGAEKLCFAFRMAPSFDITLTQLENGHREYQIICTLKHIVTGYVLGSGVGCCSTMESKYRWRKAERVCPECGSTAIIKGKAEYGGGWICFARKGGCGEKFKDDDAKITGQEVGRTENTDIADVYNTVLKIGKKRAHVDAVLTATAASDIFAQDIEENPEMYGGKSEETKPKPETTAHSEIQTIEASILNIIPNDDKALAKEGWHGIMIDGDRIIETKDAALVSKAKGFKGTGEIIILEIEWVKDHEWPALKAMELKQ